MAVCFSDFKSSVLNQAAGCVNIEMFFFHLEKFQVLNNAYGSTLRLNDTEIISYLNTNTRSYYKGC